MNKIRVNITVDKYAWEQLPKYISIGKSTWINQQIWKQINSVDNIDEINMQIDAIEYQERTLANDKSLLIEKREFIQEQRKNNEKNLKIINDAMMLIRTIVGKQGYIEKSRVQFIANKHVLDVNVLLSQCEKENIDVKDIEVKKDVDTNDSQPY